MEEEMEFSLDAVVGCLTEGELGFQTLCFVMHFHLGVLVLSFTFGKLPLQIIQFIYIFKTLTHSHTH